MDVTRKDIVMAANDQSSRPLAVIALMQSCPVAAPAEMTLLSLERWTTFFALRWFFATTQPTDEIDLRLQAGLTWQAHDDQGIHYVGGDYGGGGGNSPHWVRTTWFSPALDPTAQLLKLRFDSPLGGSILDAEVHLAP